MAESHGPDRHDGQDPPRWSMDRPLKPDPDARCDRCGGFGAFDLGDRRLCEECCGAFGSCCLEFGADDLWRGEESPSL